MWRIIVGVLGGLITLVGGLLALSRGKPRPIVDANGQPVAGIGTTRDMKSVVTGVFIPSWLSREFTLREKVNLWRGKFFSMRLLRNTAFATDLTQHLTELTLPVYFFSGAYDYTCN